MFCGKCGQHLSTRDQFCPRCGEPAISTRRRIGTSGNLNSDGAYGEGHRNGVQPVYSYASANAAPSTVNRKRKPLLIALILGVVALITAVVLIVFLSPSQQVDFNIEYSTSGVEKFLQTVCRNINAEKAVVVDPDYDSPAGSSCIASRLEIKRKGKVAEEVQARFYNAHHSDTVSRVEVIFYSSDKSDIFDCRKELVFGLEKTLTHKAYADQFIPSYYEAQSIAYSIESLSEKRKVASYWLNDDLKVDITIEPTLGRDWYLFYRLSSGIPRPDGSAVGENTLVTSHRNGLPRLIDDANLLSSEERESLTELLNSASDRTETDIIIVTASTIGGKDPTAYADDYYDDNSYGYGNTKDGILLLISMEGRDWVLSTSGTAIDAFPDTKLDSLSVSFVPHLSKGEYSMGFRVFVEGCLDILENR